MFGEAAVFGAGGVEVGFGPVGADAERVAGFLQGRDLGAGSGSRGTQTGGRADGARSAVVAIRRSGTSRAAVSARGLLAARGGAAEQKQNGSKSIVSCNKQLIFPGRGPS